MLIAQFVIQSCTSDDAKNLINDGSFENQRSEFLDSPWIIRPDSTQRFVVVEGKNTKDGRKCAKIEAVRGKWFEISQFLDLANGRNYQVSFYVKGDSCELHSGAWSEEYKKFLGWNNDIIPHTHWEEALFQFGTDSLHASTKLYIAIRNEITDTKVTIDDVRVTTINE